MFNFRRSFSFPMPHTPQTKLMPKAHELQAAVHQTTPKSLSPHYKQLLSWFHIPCLLTTLNPSTSPHVMSNLKQTSGDQFCFTV